MRQRFNRLVLGVTLCLILGLSGLVSSPPVVSASGIDSIPDPALRALIREALNRPYGDIALAELVDIQRLRGTHRGIQDISGLQYLTNLSEIDLTGNSISDLTPLAALYAATEGAKLHHVYLAGNLITDITPLAGMTRLETLDLTANQIQDVTPFYREHGLYGVTWLSLAGNQIQDVAGLRNLTELEFLALDQNQITDISPLAANRGLGLGDTVLLQGNPLDANSLGEVIPALQTRRVQIFWGPAVTITPLAPPEIPVVFADPGLAAAVRLVLPEAGDVVTAAELAAVTELHAAGLEISDLQGIEAMAALTVLDLSGNQIADTRPLYYLTGLKALNLSGNRITTAWYLLQNTGLDAGDTLDLTDNSLDTPSMADYIPQLEARGVTLRYDPPPEPTPTPTPTSDPTPAPETPSTATTPPQVETVTGGFDPAAPVKGIIGALGGGLFGVACLWGLYRLRLSRSSGRDR
jgi:Leucine-rich repeat (LRR) protein